MAVHPRNGPPEPVSTTRLRSSRRSPRSAIASAACSESTGRSRSGSPLIRSMTSSPPTTSDSLLARASVFPLWSAASVGPSPDEPTSAFSTMSASASDARRSAAIGPDDEVHTPDRAEVRPDLLRRRLIGDPDDRRQELADLAGEELLVRPRCGQADDLEPVGIATDHIQRLGPDRARRSEDGDAPHCNRLPPCAREQGATGPERHDLGTGRSLEGDDPQQEEGGRRHEQQRIDPVEDAPVSGENAPHVLHTHVALDQ